MTGSFRERAEPFVASGVLALADVHAVSLTAPRLGETDPERMLGLAFAVRAPRVGHAGVDLAHIAQQIDDAHHRSEVDDAAPLSWPDGATWQARTCESPMVGAPEDRDRPFVSQPLARGTLLLTRRMYREQELVAEALVQRAARELPERARVLDLDARLAALFPGEADGEAARAARLAAERCLALVIGGPGTGKTYSITRLLAALLEDRDPSDRLGIELAAPTGKAAVRMREAIREATSPPGSKLPAELGELEPRTLHRLIGMRPDGRPRHDADHPLIADVIVVDEVSMVDLVMMRRLLEAVPPESRLILLGDRDQLASVEAGCVLADLVGDGSSGPLAGNVQLFTESRRFAHAPDVALIAACLQSYATRTSGLLADPAARIEHAADVFLGRAHAAGEQHPERRVVHLGPPEQPGEQRPARPTDEQLRLLAAPYTEGFRWLDADGGQHELEGYAQILKGRRTTALSVEEQQQILQALERYRVLSVHRRGPLGVEGLNQVMTRLVRRFLGHPAEGGRHWIGRPIMVTENSYDLYLMNGDVGVVLPTESEMQAVFPADGGATVRAVALSRLPPHETALAMTVHKAQGSQFDRVALVLAGRSSVIQTRELVYTGVTRAKNQLAWLGSEAELREALARPVERASGLMPLLGVE